MPNDNQTPKSMWRTVTDDELQATQAQAPAPQQGQQPYRSLLGRMWDWANNRPPVQQEESPSEAPTGTRFMGGKRIPPTYAGSDVEPIVDASIGAMGGAIAPALRGIGGGMARGGATALGTYLGEHGLRGQMPTLKGAAIATGTGAVAGPLLEWGGGSLLQKILRRSGLSRAAGAGAQESVGVLTPEEVAQKYGLKYRGEVSPGTGVHDFQHPDGGSFALKADQMRPDFIEQKMAKRAVEINPENLDPVARAKAAGIATPQSQAAETGLWHAGQGAGVPNPASITPENRRLIQKLLDSGIIPRN